MEINSYLSRIGYQGPIEPSAAVLSALQQAHLLTVPFENLDIHLGRPIQLSLGRLYEKIVIARRGGFCYELNGLFSWALESLGFGVVRLSASGANDDGSYAAEFDHLLLQVHSPEDPETAWLVDVGWGNGPFLPLQMLEPGEQRLGSGTSQRVFRLRPEGCCLVLEERAARGLEGEGHAQGWVRHYRFNLTPHPLSAFEGMCSYHQTSPESLFTQKRLATRFTPTGRVTLSNRRLIETLPDGTRSERELADEEEVRAVLKDFFDLAW